METILAITNSTSCAIRLIVCKTYDEAIRLMKDTYNNLLNGNDYDFYNTFFDEDSGYAQIVSGLEQIEFRLGKLSMQ